MVDDIGILQKVRTINLYNSLLIQLKLSYLANHSGVHPLCCIFLFDVRIFFQIPFLVQTVTVLFRKFDLNISTQNVNHFRIVCIKFNKLIFIFEFAKWNSSYNFVDNFMNKKWFKLSTLILTDS